EMSNRKRNASRRVMAGTPESAEARGGCYTARGPECVEPGRVENIARDGNDERAPGRRDVRARGYFLSCKAAVMRRLRSPKPKPSDASQSCQPRSAVFSWLRERSSRVAFFAVRSVTFC